MTRIDKTPKVHGDYTPKPIQGKIIHELPQSIGKSSTPTGKGLWVLKKYGTLGTILISVLGSSPRK